ncbi:IucA/IucC family C-terminal-domain containing protein [Bacillus sp. FJAT-27445]|uniref:IucA/IucC family C-terminal-domain containing protein n=1 Tax=Bacillus sp. FJAT-27445 TaxID=1679166 RepID=UPI000743BFF5|nr:IucA/IucC family C-terminal-domain containing protein [Bacillus sp. FJAT-27445]
MVLQLSLSQLNEVEKDALKDYRFAAERLYRMISVKALLDPLELKAFIDQLKVTFQTDSEKVAASVFIKRYAFLAVLALYTMSAWNKKLDIRPENIYLEPPSADPKWLPKFYLTNTQTGEVNTADRQAFRRQAVSELFAGHLFPLISLLAKTTGVSKLILWENIAVYIMWLYESKLEKEPNAGGDLDFIFKKAEGSLFGSYNHNPIKKFYYEKTYVDDLDEMVRIRQTCCFSYLTGGKSSRCKTCPCRKLEMEGKCSNGPENVCDAVRSLT